MSAPLSSIFPSSGHPAANQFFQFAYQRLQHVGHFARRRTVQHQIMSITYIRETFLLTQVNASISHAGLEMELRSTVFKKGIRPRGTFGVVSSIGRSRSFTGAYSVFSSGYENQTGCVSGSAKFRITRKGNILSPLLFNAALDFALSSQRSCLGNADVLIISDKTRKRSLTKNGKRNGKHTGNGTEILKN